MLEWVFYIAAAGTGCVALNFVVLYIGSDIVCKVWPPCVSELMEVHKPAFIICFGFTCGMAWLNLVFVALLQRSEALVAYATVVFFAIMGIMAFDLNAHWRIHHLFVTLYIAASLAYSNTLRVDWVAWCVNSTTALFVAVALARLLNIRWTPAFKLAYTTLECMWVASFFLFMLVNAAVCRLDYGALLLAVDGGHAGMQWFGPAANATIAQ